MGLGREVFWHAAGSPIEVEYSAHPIADGKVPGAVLVFRVQNQAAGREPIEGLC